MNEKTEISRDEALQRIKAETIAFDWCLNQRRIKLLSASFAALEQALPGRRGFAYVLNMAGSTMVYLERHGDAALPAALDFFKQALAHLVTMLEEDDLSEVREAEIFHQIYERFEILKKKINPEKKAAYR